MSFHGKRFESQTETDGTTREDQEDPDLDVLSEPESVLSVASISGRIKSSWDAGVSHERWLFPSDRSVPFSRGWSVEEWDSEAWRGRLREEKEWQEGSSLSLNGKGGERDGGNTKASRSS